jgi:hypothetical protein
MHFSLIVDRDINTEVFSLNLNEKLSVFGWCKDLGKNSEFWVSNRK